MTSYFKMGNTLTVFVLGLKVLVKLLVVSTFETFEELVVDICLVGGVQGISQLILNLFKCGSVLVISALCFVVYPAFFP